MKAFFALLIATVSAGAVSVARDTCGTTIDPLYRLYNSANFDHFYTYFTSPLLVSRHVRTTPAEVISSVSTGGLVLEGVAAATFPTQQGTTLPLYQLYNSAALDHFYTTSTAEHDAFIANNGYALEGTVAFVYTTQICGSVPLYRLHAVSHVDHFYTTSATERASALALGFVDQGIAGYVPGKGIIGGDVV
ncbi:hypothetical protein DFH09DRAFT_1370136 [Mycena vulgaris]|nr:hypothetical protein DFH09DRAFT_1370136 [Mycena vulgaris]